MTLRELFLQLAYMHGIGDEVRALLKDRPPPPAIGLGPYLTQRRAASGGLLLQIHKRSGISRSQLSLYEHGQQWNPGIRTIQALAYGYRVPFAEVLAAAMTDAGPFVPPAPGAPRVNKRPPNPPVPEVRKRKRTEVR